MNLTPFIDAAEPAERVKTYLARAEHRIARTPGQLLIPPLAESRREVINLLAEARRYQVSFQPGAKFSSGPGLSNYLRLSFAYYEIEELLEGVSRLAQVIG